jgi:uracil-DNA glycosylase family 4
MDNDKLYKDLANEVETCRRCLMVDHSMCLLGPLNGPLDSEIMFVGTAPGKKVEGVPQMPFAVGPSSERFNNYLRHANIARDRVHITNAVLHIPLDGNGKARNPSQVETMNCSNYLKRQIEIVNPLIVVPLGTLALSALYIIESSSDVSRGKGKPWYNRHLFLLGHPSPLSRVTMAEHMGDYLKLRYYYLKLKNK